MESKKGLTLNGMTGMNFLFILNAAAMVGVSTYLTSHFYEVRYPEKLGGAASLCNVSNFFNCDAATYSGLAAIVGVPTSFFGLIMGLLFLFSALMPSEALEKTSNAFARYNFIGCVFLFLFSLGALGSLCPFCTVYYVLSGIALFLLYKGGLNSWKPDFKVTAFWGGLVVAGAVMFYFHTQGKEDRMGEVNKKIVEQYLALPDIKDPVQESPYKLNMVTEKFADAPIRISVFSDFECPFCKTVSEQIPQLIRRYPGKINVQYFFYPLDHSCNANIKHQFHENACQAAYLAACDEKQFHVLHDEIFAVQDSFKSGALKKLEDSFKLSGCMAKPENKTKVINLINAATQFNIKSTPTVIVNGKKIEGTIMNSQYFAIFDKILSEKK